MTSLPPEILERISDAFVALDSGWRYVYVNAKAGELFGRDPASLVGKHIWTEFPEGVGQPFHLAYERAMRDLVPIVMEEYYPPWNRWYENRIYPSPEGLSIFFTDITERKLALAAISESEHRFRTLFEESPAGVFLFDRALCISDCNVRFADLLRTSRERLQRFDMRGIRDRRILPALEAVLRGEESRYEGPYQTTISGVVIWISMRVRPLRDLSGDVLGGIGMVEDITDRKQLEAEYMASEAHYRRLVQTSPYGIYALDNESRFTEINRAGADLLGRPAADILGRSFSEMVAPQDAPRLRAALQQRQALDEAEAYDIEFEAVLPSGERRLLHVRAAAIQEGGRILGTHGVARDISEERRLEVQLRQASKMQAVGQLAGGVAHDFNNLLMVISGFAALLEEKTEAGSEAALYVQEIRKAAHRSADMTRQLLAFGRRQVLRPEVLELNDVVRSAQGMLRRLIPATVEIVTRLAAPPVKIRADPTQIEQVLINLVVNARDAMPGGGTLTLRTGRRTVTAHRIRGHPFLEPGRYASLVVRDTGQGMDDETRSHIFEPFFTSKPLGQGTGLGLSTVDGIVKQSGGFVWAESTPGRGSTFTVLLPRVDEGEPGGVGAKERKAPSGSGTILLVEDEGALRALIRVALQRAGYTILDAPNGEEALRVARDRGAPIDLLLTDMVLPGVGGKALAERLRERDPGLPVVLMSGYADEMVSDGGALPPRTTFVQKPVDPDVLVEHIAAALETVRRSGA